MCRGRTRSRVPKPRHKIISLTTCYDANLAHDEVTRKSITGVIDLAIKKPIITRSKSQNTVETSTFGVDFNAGRTATDNSIEVRCMLGSLGVTVDKPNKVEW